MKKQTTVPEETIHISIHPTQLKELPKEIRKAFLDHQAIEFYPKGKKRGKKINKADEFKQQVYKYLEEIENNKGEESNVEALIVDCMIELLQKMSLSDIRNLNLKRLVEIKK